MTKLTIELAIPCYWDSSGVIEALTSHLDRDLQDVKWNDATVSQQEEISEMLGSDLAVHLVHAKLVRVEITGEDDE